MGVVGLRLDYDRRVRDRGLARRSEEEAPQWIAYCFTENDNGRNTTPIREYVPTVLTKHADRHHYAYISVRAHVERDSTSQGSVRRLAGLPTDAPPRIEVGLNRRPKPATTIPW